MSKMNFRLCLLVACLLVVHSSPTQGLSLLGLKLDLNSVLSPLGLGKKTPAVAKPEAPVDEDNTVVREARQINPGTTTPAATDSDPADAKPVAENGAAADDATTIAPGSSAGPDDDAEIQPVTDDGVAVVDEPKTAAPENSPDSAVDIKPAIDEGATAVDEPKTTVPEVAPPAVEEGAVAEESKPVSEDPKTSAPEESPVAEASKPIADESSSASPEVAPTAGEESPVAKDSKPIADESSSASPEVASPAAKVDPVAEDSKQIADESSSASPEVAPPAAEESPVAKNTKQIADKSSTAAPEVAPPAVKKSPVAEDRSIPDESSTSGPVISPPAGAPIPTAVPIGTPAAPKESAVTEESKPVEEISNTPAPKDNVVTPRAGDADTINSAPTVGPPQPPIICNRNEEYGECKELCPKSCDQPYPPKCYGIVCQPGCNCKQGYFRDSLDRCILPIFCPFDKAFPWLKRLLFDRPHLECGQNAEYSTCSNFCVKTCRFPDRMCALQSLDMCTKGCVCKDGYVLDKYGRCILAQNC